jgi:hypothetical protein
MSAKRADSKPVEESLEALLAVQRTVSATREHFDTTTTQALPGQRGDTVQQGQKLATEALQKLVDGVVQSATLLTHYLDTQMSAVEQLELSVDTLTAVWFRWVSIVSLTLLQRARLAHDLTGVTTMHSLRTPVPQASYEKNRRLKGFQSTRVLSASESMSPEDELHSGSRDLPVYRREKIDLTALDRIGAADYVAPPVLEPRLHYDMSPAQQHQ